VGFSIRQGDCGQSSDDMPRHQPPIIPSGDPPPDRRAWWQAVRWSTPQRWAIVLAGAIALFASLWWTVQ
jgi:hypothetical protein